MNTWPLPTSASECHQVWVPFWEVIFLGRTSGLSTVVQENVSRSVIPTFAIFGFGGRAEGGYYKAAFTLWLGSWYQPPRHKSLKLFKLQVYCIPLWSPSYIN